MNTVKITYLDGNQTFEEVISFQVGHQMIQMVFPSGEHKVVCNFEEIDITPEADVMEDNLKRYQEMVEESNKKEETKPKLESVE